MYHSLQNAEGVLRDPVMSLMFIGVCVLIAVPVLLFQYRRQQREPIHVEIEDPAQGAPSDARLDSAPVVLVASRGKVAILLIAAIASIGLLALFMWGQPGVCRVAGIGSLVPFVVFAIVFAALGLLKPERLEIAHQGLTHVTFWRLSFWSWDEIRNITVIKARMFGSTWTSGIWFNRFADTASSPGPAHPALRPVWPIASDELAALLNEARLRWSSARGPTLVPVKTPIADRILAALPFVPMGLLVWLMIAHPCGS